MKIIAILVAIVVLGGISFFALNTYIYTEKQADLSEFTLGTYGYRCGDGTEFTMSPKNDMSQIHIVPATSVERIPETILSKEESESGVGYQGDGITFEAHGETVTLSTDAFTTTCTPIGNLDEAPFNFGD